MELFKRRAQLAKPLLQSVPYEEYGIVVAMMQSQGYDGAASMAGMHRGLQARFRQQIPVAIYTHCKEHMQIVHARK